MFRELRVLFLNKTIDVYVPIKLIVVHNARYLSIVISLFLLSDATGLGLVSSVLAKRLTGKNVSEMTCFVSGGT